MTTSNATTSLEAVAQLNASDPIYPVSHYNGVRWTYSRHGSWQSAYASTKEDAQAVVFGPITDGFRIMRVFGSAVADR
jgi:hypothetical protein